MKPLHHQIEIIPGERIDYSTINSISLRTPTYVGNAPVLLPHYYKGSTVLERSEPNKFQVKEVLIHVHRPASSFTFL